jgi:hypothetical protein
MHNETLNFMNDYPEKMQHVANVTNMKTIEAPTI